MHTIQYLFTKATSAFRNRYVQTAIMVLALALFVFAAGAPNATVGIGK